MSPTLLRFLETPEINKETNPHNDVYKLVYTHTGEISATFREFGKEPEISKHLPDYQLFVLKIQDRILLRKILDLPSVIFADLYFPPKEELEVSNFDPSVNLINVLHKNYPLANGNGLNISIKENIFDTLDIDFRGRYIRSNTQSPTYSGHASVMATLAGGAGNTSAGSLGVSPGVNFTSSNFANLFPDPAAHFQQYNISVQNHSYGIMAENFYGAEARAYDQQLNANTSLAHVFSVGNSGLTTTETGVYAGLKGVANTTGNFKVAKNIISVAACDSFFGIPAAISKGPAYDGRLKPEITAFGEDGSSGAAAIVSGTIISLQHLYRQLYGSMPPTALIRAVLFNSANDIGAQGIDFASGYGSLNAVRAAEHISNGRFFSGNLHQRDTVEFSVSIPAGIKRAKFTLAWNDPANNLLASKGLVNNADMEVVRLADHAVFQPWVLNHFPHPDSLVQLPKRKADTLNNAEQVTVDDPLSGNYKIRIYGSAIPIGPQSFHVAYQFDSAFHFEFTYPVKNDQFAAGKANTIRWHSTISGNGTLLYSLDNVAWHTVAENIDLDKGYAVWQTPDTLSGCMLKLTGPANVISDSFVISTPASLQIGFDCPEDFMLFWNKQQHASGYELFRLGQKYLEPFARQADTFAVLLKSSQPSLHYAMRALLPNGLGAQRSYAYNYSTQGVECFIRTFLAELNDDEAHINLQLGTTYGIQKLFLEKLGSNGFVTLQEVSNPVSLSYSFTDNALKTGLNNYRIRILRNNGQINYSSLATVYYFGQQPYLVYPNPLLPGGILHVVNASLNRGIFSLYNMAGQLVLSKAMRNFDELIPTAALQAGMYFYTLAEEGKVVQRGKLLVW